MILNFSLALVGYLGIRMLSCKQRVFCLLLDCSSFVQCRLGLRVVPSTWSFFLPYLEKAKDRISSTKESKASNQLRVSNQTHKL